MPCSSTSQDVVLVILVGNAAQSYQGVQSSALDEFVHEILVVLEDLLQREECSTLVAARHVQQFV